MGWVLHVDLDQFIAAVEVLRRPELRGRPVVVGGDGDPAKRGVVATASYEAREHGVQSGMPLRTAARRLPDAVFLPVDFGAYEAVSAEVMSVLRSSGAVVEVLGWDEAFLGVSTDDPEGFARSLQAAVLDTTRLHCSVGIGQNKLQAKIATGFGKPAGVFRLTSANWFTVLGALPTDALWGIGRKTAKKLAGLGVETVAGLAAADPSALAAAFGPMTGPWLVLLGRGIGDSEVSDAPYVARGHGREETFQSDIESWPAVEAEVARIAGRVTADLLAAEPARPVVRVVVKVRYRPFITETHGVAVKGMTLEEAALAALSRFTGRRPVRLLGVRVEFGDLGQFTGGESGDQQQRVQQAPPVGLTQVLVQRAGHGREGGDELRGEFFRVAAEAGGHGPRGLLESACAAEPDERGRDAGGGFGRRDRRGGGLDGDGQVRAKGGGKPGEGGDGRVAATVLQVGDVGDGQAGVGRHRCHRPARGGAQRAQLLADCSIVHAPPILTE
jgi:nucleotidyltransferase/DNA polymerase involved in DNA repair